MALRLNSHAFEGTERKSAWLVRSSNRFDSSSENRFHFTGALRSTREIFPSPRSDLNSLPVNRNFLSLESQSSDKIYENDRNVLSSPARLRFFFAHETDSVSRNFTCAHIARVNFSQNNKQKEEKRRRLIWARQLRVRFISITSTFAGRLHHVDWADERRFVVLLS